MRPKKKGDQRRGKIFNKNGNEAAKESEQATSKTVLADVASNSKPDSLKVGIAAPKSESAVDIKIDSTNEHKYHKREIKSNWDRYDLPNDFDDASDETFQSTVTTRGEDFTAVQTVSGGVGSQFRFQDEKDWADVINVNKSESLNQFQLLDTRDLSLSLANIPFQRRLSIAAEYFTQEQLLKFENAAIENQKIFQKRNSSTIEFIHQAPNSPNTCINPTHTSEQCVTDAFPAKPDESREIKLSKNHNKTIAIGRRNKDNINETAASDTLITCSDIQIETRDGNELEDELDALLKMNAISKPSCNITPVVAFNIGNQTSNLLTTNPPMKMPDISDLPKQSLEDWLDDVLNE